MSKRCCDLHNHNCEPPSELCCDECNEWDHPRHPEGVTCTWSTPEVDEARVRLYAQAMYDPHGLGASDFLIRNDRDFWRKTTVAAIAVADEEHATLRAEVEKAEADAAVGWNEAAVETAGRKAAEADLADARERLRRCEERLAAVAQIPNIAAGQGHNHGAGAGSTDCAACWADAIREAIND